MGVFHSLLMARIISSVSGRMRFRISEARFRPIRAASLGLRFSHRLDRKVENVCRVTARRCEVLVFVRIDERRKNFETVTIGGSGRGLDLEMTGYSRIAQS